jgi:hypothetical protein
MYNLTFKAMNRDGKEIEHKYINHSDFLSQMDYSENIDIPMLDDEVTEFIYYDNRISLKQNMIQAVSDIYDYCSERE